MIPKPLNAIQWADLEALRDSGREEDDMIEYKGGFSDGSDFTIFNDQQKKNSTDKIAREVVAFLNTRGGDVIVGAKEAGGENPRIESLTPVANVVETVNRLDSALAALIEPKQAIIGVRAILRAQDASDGVIVIRAPSSLRAPHRTSRDKDCYIRRGSKSVPMPMDEVQDVTLNRAARRNERLDLLDRQFAGMAEGKIGYRQLQADHFAARMVFVPHDMVDIELTVQRLAAMASTNSSTYRGTELTNNAVAFETLPGNWRPVLRGRELNGYSGRKNMQDGRDEFSFSRKLIHSNGIVSTDWACRKFGFSGQNDGPYIHHEWLRGFLAHSLHALAEVLDLAPQHAFGVLRIAINAAGSIEFLIGRNDVGSQLHFPSGFIALPDFEVHSAQTLGEIFKQAQIDVLALLGREPVEIWSLNPEP